MLHESPAPALLYPSQDDSFRSLSVESLRFGDEDAWGVLLLRVEGPLLKLASRRIYRSLRPKVEASDIVQETFLLAHRSRASFRGSKPDEFVAWIHRIFSNRLKRAVRDHRYVQKRSLCREVRLDNQELRDSLLDHSSPPCEIVQLREERELLEESLRQLSWEDQSVISDHFVHGFSFAEMAVRCDRPESTVRKRWSRAMGRWRRCDQRLRMRIRPSPSHV